MNDGKVTLNRPLVGIIALGCLGAFGYLMSASFNTPDDNLQMWAGAFGRVGLLMGALWLALPSKNHEAAWANVAPSTLIGLILGIAWIAWKPKVAIPFLLILGVLAFFLRPRGKYRPPRDYRD